MSFFWNISVFFSNLTYATLGVTAFAVNSITEVFISFIGSLGAVRPSSRLAESAVGALYEVPSDLLSTERS
jgi:hypothetical protein